MFSSQALRCALALLLGCLALAISAPAAAAVSCTVTGTLKLEPLDAYYCDTNHSQDCSAWKEVDLDVARGSSAKPLRYMQVEISQNQVFLARTFTSSTGWYSKAVTLPGSTCAGQNLEITYKPRRVHESDINASTPRFRFQIVAYDPTKSEDQMTSIWYHQQAVTATGSTTTVNVTWGTNSNDHFVRVVNLYYQANSALTEMVSWHSRLSSHFASTNLGAGGVARILFGPGASGRGGQVGLPGWLVKMGYDVYNNGIFVRHELGHLARHAIHDKACDWTGCMTTNYRYVSGYHADSCEYGSNATDEALAAFFAVRSIVGNTTNAWECNLGDATNQDLCNERTTWTLDADKTLGRDAFVAIGDRWVTSSAHCKRVRRDQGCDNCAIDAQGFCTNSGLYGWRNRVQVTRFLWDLVDSSNDGGHDGIYYSMNGLLAKLAGMPTSFGTDGSCRESERASVSDCHPAIDGEVPTISTGSRDAYNARDIRDLFTEDTAWVASINCASFASD